MATAFTNAQVVAGSGQPQHHKIDTNGRNIMTIKSQIVNFDGIATASGVALALSDTYQALNIEAGETVITAGVQILKVATGAADIDLGFTGGNEDEFVDGINADSVSSASNSGSLLDTVHNIYFAAADTIDILEASAGASLAGCVVKVWALVVRI